ncbi:NUDIX hydrolase [Devosia ginsengisoli]|uniref:NUDIX hydrolase n=1 Tax=Devosia ginsengisoli TaxID=400770 RepID=A0A5B8LSV5_9HYPH|nr:NUDIX hydrolase [Devosia ginsengisoli]QDZ10845.1 NUDIX hydrolase [Devosia ginsengisoli]
MRIVPVTQIDIVSVPGPWPLSESQRAAVGDYWRGATAANPHLWDGRILGLSAPGGGMPSVENGVLRAEAREDAYSAFMLWRQQGFPEIGICHAFGWALIVSSDNALFYGVMGGQTANAGRVYPPGGSLEPRDVLPDDRVDVPRCIALELEEETGLRTDEAVAGGMVVVFDGPRLSFGQVFRFAEPADQLAARIRANLDRQEHRELADIVAIRSRAEAEAAGAVPYAAAVAEAYFAGAILTT